jgi:succinate dehydrogenase/fumarate reductase flavoprotein subunit
MVGLDPTTWEPTRVKLGGRLLNGLGEEFLHNYGEEEGGGYSTTRDTLTYAIYKEVELGRGSPHGGVYLSFQHIEEPALKAALGPAIEIFKSNNIDLTAQPVEVFPIAHYQMGGVEVNADMQSSVKGLYAAGELAGGANGANRLSGNALPEALVFGERAGEAAARAAGKKVPSWNKAAASSLIELIRAISGQNASNSVSPASLISELKALMWEKVGPFRTAEALTSALTRIRAMREQDLPACSVSRERVHNTSLVEWFELRGGLLAAEALALSALHRRESRGAHQRNDFPHTRSAYERSQRLWLANGKLASSFEGLPQ